MLSPPSCKKRRSLRSWASLKETKGSCFVRCCGRETPTHSSLEAFRGHEAHRRRAPGITSNCLKAQHLKKVLDITGNKDATAARRNWLCALNRKYLKTSTHHVLQPLSEIGEMPLRELDCRSFGLELMQITALTDLMLKKQTAT